MSRASRLFVLLVLAPLAACAVAPAAGKLAAGAPAPAVAPHEDIPKPTADASVLGLYLAANTAQNQGRADIAADYFARAAQEVDPAAEGFLKEQAFSAAVLAGRVEQAAGLAPGEGEATSMSNVRLGRLVVAVNALASDKGQAAYEQLDGDKIGPPFRTAATLLRPWAAAAAGNVEASLQTLEIRGDGVAQAFAQQNRALLLEKAGRIADADAAFKALMAQDTRIGVVALTYGAFLERQGRRAEASAVYDALLLEWPDDGAATKARDRVKARRPAPPAPTVAEGAGQSLLAIATTALAQNQQNNALAYLRLSLRLNPKEPESLMLLGDFLEGQGATEDSRAAYAAIPKTSVEYLAARSRLTLSYMGNDDRAKAVQIAQETVRDLPDDLDAMVNLADTLREAKDYAGALPVLNKVIAAKGKDASWQLYYARAINLEKTGQWPLAEKDLKTAIALAPNQTDLQNYLGYSWADRNENLPQALDLLKKAHQAQPNNGAILDSLGWAYFRMGDFKQAVSNLEQAVQIAPAEADINDHLGDAYLKAGRKLEARYQWERVLTLQADNQLRAAAKAKLAANPDDPAQAVAARAETRTP